MKRIVAASFFSRLKSRFRRVLVTGRAYLILSLSSMLVFILLGLAGMLQNAYAVSPVQTMKGFASSLSGHMFQSMLGMELPHMSIDPEVSPFKAARVASFLIRFVTDLNPGDPKSLLALEMPGMSPDKSVLLRPGSGGGEEAPEDHGPWGENTGDSETPPPDTDPAAGAGQVTPEPEPDPPPASPDPNPPEDEDTGGRKVVFIYHSHNRESWFPELAPGVKDANSGKINITLVGKRLARQLEAKGVGAAQSSKDYAGAVKGYNWNFSYKYSLQTVRQALAVNRNLQFFFDIHRDSQRRGKTTATIRGTDYAQVYFIIGHRNANWKKNEAFAAKIHEKLEKSHPGLSRGIWGKTAASGNGEYNQSIAPDSVLIEIGGVDNTLTESYRTADLLADVIAELYWETQDAKKVDGKADGL